MVEPSEEQEMANAAYCWSEACRQSLYEVVGRTQNLAEIKWAFDRFERAVKRFNQYDAIRNSAAKSDTSQ